LAHIERDGFARLNIIQRLALLAQPGDPAARAIIAPWACSLPSRRHRPLTLLASSCKTVEG
jgi:hypothetical protein